MGEGELLVVVEETERQRSSQRRSPTWLVVWEGRVEGELPVATFEVA